MKKLTIVVLFCAALIGLAVQPAAAGLGRIGSTITALNAGSRGSAVAFGNNKYLVVSSFGTVRGQFLAADGSPQGGLFVIQASANFTHFPRVAFSPHGDAGRGGFLVAWHESDQAGGATSVHARMVSMSGVLLSADIIVGNDSSWWEAGPAVAYSTGSGEFLIVWQSRVYQGFNHDITGARVSNTGALLGNVAVASSAGRERDPSIAYNPTTNEFLVVYAGYSTFAFVSAQRVKAGTGALIGGPIAVTQALSSFITSVSYSAATNQFVAAWYQDPPKAVYGRVIGADGSLPGSVLALSVRFRAYDGLSVAYNERSSTHLLVSNDSLSYEIGGVELAAGGTPMDAGGVLTTAADAPNYYPQVTGSNAQSEWLTVASHNFASVIGQRLGTDGTSTPPPPPPPPPPPACTVEPHPGALSVSLTGAAQSQSITVTASTSDCAWSASSSAAWITITAGASGAGPGSAAYAVARNLTGSPRSGAISVAGGTVTVNQAPSVGNAALHDATGDGGSDLIWHNVVTGRVALWNMTGHTVTSTYYLTPGGVDVNWKVVGTGDLNGDGYADLVWRRDGGGVACWLLSRGQIAATQYVTTGGAQVTEPDPMWEIRAVGDLDGDGKSDIVWQNMGVGTLRVWFMDGAAVRASVSLSHGMADWRWKIAGAGDLNADGKADIIWQSDTTGGLGAWLMSGNQVVGQSNLSIEKVPDTQWKVRGVGDTNGDGFADLLWQHTGNGSLAIWYMKNFNVILTAWLSIVAVPDTNWHVVGPG